MKLTKTNSNELRAFLSFYFAFPNNFITLIDTYDDLESGLPNTLLVAYTAEKLKLPLPLVGVRLDSGDLIQLSLSIRKKVKEFDESNGT